MSRARAKPRIALALAGGGPWGAIYEIGVDGAHTQAMHASAALERGVDLMLRIKPLMPCTRAGLATGGLQSVLDPLDAALQPA